MKAKQKLVLIADAEHARLAAMSGSRAAQRGFSCDILRKVEAEDLTSPDSLAVRDRPSRVFQSATPMRSANEHKTTPKDQNRAAFMQRLSDTMEDLLKTESFSELIVIADPRSLGVLRTSLGSEARSLLGPEIAKNLTNVADHDLASRIADLLPD